MKGCLFLIDIKKDNYQSFLGIVIEDIMLIYEGKFVVNFTKDAGLQLCLINREIGICNWEDKNL